MQNIAAKKRAGQEDVDSDYLSDNQLSRSPFLGRNRPMTLGLILATTMFFFMTSIDRNFDLRLEPLEFGVQYLRQALDVFS